MSSYFDDLEEHRLADIRFEPPPGVELIGYWCWRGGGHLCDEPCKSDSVPLFAQAGWAVGIRRNIADIDGEGNE